MNAKRYLKPFLMLAAVFIVGWTFLVDNFLGRPLDTTAPQDQQIYKFVLATGKWTAAASPGGPPSGAAGGDLTGSTYPNPVVAANKITLGKIAIAGANSVLVGAGSAGIGISYAELTLGTNLSITGTTLNASSVSAIGVQSAGSDVAGSPASKLNFNNGLQAGAVSGGISAAQPTYGSAANTVTQGNDSRLSDSRTPTAHATSHKNGGSDEVATATSAANAIPKAGAGGTLAAPWIQEVINAADLLDVTVTSLASNDILVRNGSSVWVNAAVTGDVTWTLSGNTLTTVIGVTRVTNAMLAGSIAATKLTAGSNSTVLQTSSGGVVQFATVTNAMLAGGITDGNLASSYVLADGSRALTANWGVGNFAITGVKELRFQGQAGVPSGFATGGETYDTTTGNFVQAHATGNVTVSGSTSILTASSTVTGQTGFTDIGATQSTVGCLVGNTFRNVKRGLCGVNATDTYTWQLLYGAVVLCSFSASNPSVGGTSQLVEIETDATIRSAGTSGTVAVTAKLLYQGGSSTAVFIQRNGTAVPVTINTTTTNTWKWQVKHSSTNSANTVTIETDVWEKIN